MSNQQPKTFAEEVELRHQAAKKLRVTSPELAEKKKNNQKGKTNKLTIPGKNFAVPV